MRRIQLVAVFVATLASLAGCAESTEHDAAGRLVLSDDFYKAIASRGEPSSTMADVVLNGKIPDDVEVEGLPDTPKARLGFFLAEVTALPEGSTLGGMVEADDAIEPLVIPALAHASAPMPENGTSGGSEVLLDLAPQIRAILRDGTDDEQGEVLDALANVFGGNSDSSAIDAFERDLEDQMQQAVEEDLRALGPRASTAQVDKAVTALGHDWITPTARAVGSSYRTFCQNRAEDCDDEAFEGRVDLFQRQSLVPLFTNIPPTALPAVLKKPEMADYPARDSDEEQVWTKWLLDHDLSPLSEFYEAAGRDHQR